MLLNLEDKKEHLGAVYTPDDLADYVAKVQLKYIVKKYTVEANNLFKGNSSRDNYMKNEYLFKKLLAFKILDPACGDASLLIAFERNINLKLKELLNHNLGLNFCTESINKRDYDILGADIDYDAVLEAEKRFIKEYSNINQYRNYRLLNTNSIKPIEENSTSMGWSKLLKESLGGSGLQGLIANPPWGASILNSRSELKDAGYQLAVGQYDSYDLFVELSLKIVQEGAIMAFILPDSIFLPEHKNLRELLLKNTQLKMIARLGEGFFPKVYRACVVIIVEKRKPDKNSVTKCVRLNKEIRKKIFMNQLKLSEAEKTLGHTVNQRRFYADPEFRFDIDIREEEELLVTKIEKSKNDWNKMFDTGRGVEISKKGLVIECPNCKQTRPQPKKDKTKVICYNCKNELPVEEFKEKTIVLKGNNKYGWIPLIVGEDVSRYKSIPKHFIKPNVKGVNYKNETLNNEKILIRKTGVGINATLDRQGLLTSQTVFHFTLKKNLQTVYTHESILGILNSRVMLYYYLKKYGDNEWKSHPYITQKIVKQLPIPIINEDEKDERAQLIAIHEIVTKLINSYDYDLDIELESLVAGLYKLDSNDCILINNGIRDSEQLKAISALTLPQDVKIVPKIVSKQGR
ncbi:TaqI-like C-terminal specificity domain-containing protein [Evansella sp. AB-P1]|uniref:TaqI-like C-terminal specificity domain-containing protein n=1 Tax=Evansella sp. AB-P1 TaxID=3037653 RepID=UPI00241C2EED|nr:TaqI-like C-terminal specificity domain-containing protein [Evansella sp. AB-P1]MDG5789780.1 TaqI-like C-terminal specificity domain-containing protein [Evansella sp. AB-P1]